jgi:hypothetical protein
MIELFSRRSDAIQLPDDAVLTPLPIDEDISSLSAILLDDDYYTFLRSGKVVIDGVTILGPAYLIPFKAKAWLDLSMRKKMGEPVDSKNIRKHKNDVFRLTDLLNPEMRIAAPATVINNLLITLSICVFLIKLVTHFKLQVKFLTAPITSSYDISFA